jgi:hypothetical protein
MRRAGWGALAAVVVLSGAGCFGPQMLTRQMDDWAQRTYHENPWLMGNLLSWALLKAVFAVTGVLDGFTNAYYFWFRDAKPFGDGVGTTFEHTPVIPGKR